MMPTVQMDLNGKNTLSPPTKKLVHYHHFTPLAVLTKLFYTWRPWYTIDGQYLDMGAWLRSWWKWALFRVKYRLKFSVRRFSLRRFSLRSLRCGAFTAEPSLRNLHCELSLRISSAEIVLLGFHTLPLHPPPPPPPPPPTSRESMCLLCVLSWWSCASVFYVVRWSSRTSTWYLTDNSNSWLANSAGTLFLHWSIIMSLSLHNPHFFPTLHYMHPPKSNNFLDLTARGMCSMNI